MSQSALRQFAQPIGLALLWACGSAPPPAAPITSGSSRADGSPPKVEAPKTEAASAATSMNVNVAESAEDGALAFFAAVVAGDRKAALARTVSFDEMSAMTKKVTDRAAYDAEIVDQIERLCQELANKNVKVKSARVLRLRTATVAENSEKVKQDVELAAMAVTFELDGKTREAPAFSFIRVGSSWKFTTKNS